jgi:diguanylate cyclase (GGDEF)-like protein
MGRARSTVGAVTDLSTGGPPPGVALPPTGPADPVGLAGQPGGPGISRYTGLHCARAQGRGYPGYLIAALTVTLVYPLLPPVARMVAFLAVSLSTLPAVVIGLRRTAPGDRGPWWFLLAALASLNADNVTWYVYVFGAGRATGDGTVASLFAALGQILMFSGAIAVVARRGRNDIGGLIDSTVVSMAAGGVLWDFLLFPHLRATHVPAAMQATTCVAVFMLTGVLGALARMLQTARGVIPALWLLVISMAASLSGIVTVALVIDPAVAARPAWTDMIYLVGYAALGLFGIDRSAGRLLRPGPAPTDDLSAGRLAFLGVAVAAMPVVGGVRQLIGQDADGFLLAVVATVVTPLVMVRIGRLASERGWAEWALRYEASHDRLTTLPNRAAFTGRLTAALRSGAPLVVVFCDLDGFKAVNDRYGHAAGDRLLIEVATRLRRCIRVGDVVSRFAGDEFMILCPDAGARDAAELCRRIEAALSQPIELAGVPVRVGASIGTVARDGSAVSGDADPTGAGRSAEDLIHRADAAMYAAKRDRPAGLTGVRAVAA